MLIAFALDGAELSWGSLETTRADNALLAEVDWSASGIFENETPPYQATVIDAAVGRANIYFIISSHSTK